MTSKQRAQLRAMANTIEPIFQVGKGQIGEQFIRQIDDVLEVRELIKITVLKTAGLSAAEVSEILCRETGAQGVQNIGQKVVLYRPSKENPKIVLG